MNKREKQARKDPKRKMCQIPPKKPRKVVSNVSTSLAETPSLDGKDAILAQRSRIWALQFYCDISRAEDLLQRCDHFAYIKHDKDDTTPHYHLVVTFANARTGQSVLKGVEVDDLTEDTTVNLQAGRDRHALARYLLHDTPKARADGKHLYDESEVHTDDVAYWYEDEVVPENEAPVSPFVDDLLSARLSARQMAYKYGRDYIRNYRTYQGFANEQREIEFRERAAKAKEKLTEELEKLCEDPNVENCSFEVANYLVSTFIPDLILAATADECGVRRGMLCDKHMRDIWRRVNQRLREEEPEYYE